MADDFSCLTREEEVKTRGGLYRGPTTPGRWIELLLERLKYRQD
jgi:hypothetical protein